MRDKNSTHPLDPNDLPRKVETVRDVLNGIRQIQHTRSERFRALNIRDAADRIGAQMAKYGYQWPGEAFLLETAELVLNGYEGVTREPVKVQR